MQIKYIWMVLSISEIFKNFAKFEFIFYQIKRNLKKWKIISLKNFGSFKKIVTINSNTRDSFTKNKNKIDNKYIVLLDDFFDHPSSIKLRGKNLDTEIKEHYILLNKFLKKIKIILKRNCYLYSPKDNLKKKKNIQKF